MRWSLAAVVTTTAVASALVAAGCGSGSSGAGKSSKGPIKILTFGDISGLAPTPIYQLQSGVEAAVDAFNAAGGVQGRKVDLITCDAKLNPSLAAGCVSKAASEGVVAAIPSLEALDNVTTPILEKEGIPIIGTNPSTATAQYSRTSACYVGGPFILSPQAGTYLAGHGAKSLSISLPAGLANQDVMTQAVRSAAAVYGAKVPLALEVPTTATDFSSVAAQLTSAGEDATYITPNPPGLFSLISDLAQSRSGLKLAVPGYTAARPQVMAAFNKLPAARNVFMNNFNAFPTDTSVPGIRLFDQEIAKINKSYIGDETALFPWINAWGGMQILGSIKSGPIDAQTILKAMKTVTLNFEGVVPPWHYSYNALGLGCVTDNEVYEGVYNGGSAVTPLNGGRPVVGLTPSIIALYKKAFASYTR